MNTIHWISEHHQKFHLWSQRFIDSLGDWDPVPIVCRLEKHCHITEICPSVIQCEHVHRFNSYELKFNPKNSWPKKSYGTQSNFNKDENLPFQKLIGSDTILTWEICNNLILFRMSHQRSEVLFPLFLLCLGVRVNMIVMKLKRSKTIFIHTHHTFVPLPGYQFVRPLAFTQEDCLVWNVFQK